MMRPLRNLIRGIGVITIVLTASGLARAQDPVKVPAVKPPVAVQPPQVQIREQVLPYTVRLAGPVPRPIAFGDGGSMWRGRCEGRTCTVMAPQGAAAGQVCRNLPAHFGTVEGVARGSEEITAGELKECNRVRLSAVQGFPPSQKIPGNAPDLKEAPAGGREAGVITDGRVSGDDGGPLDPSDAGPQPEPPTQPDAKSALREAPAEWKEGPVDLKETEAGLKEVRAPAAEPDVRSPVELPVPPPDSREGAAAAVEEMDRRRGARDAAERVREDMARRRAAPAIYGFGHTTACLPAATNTLEIVGVRFGPTASGRRIAVGPPGRRFEVRWIVPALSWSDTRVTVRLPETLTAGEWGVAIVDASGISISDIRTFRRCPETFPISGRITLDACNATIRDLSIRLVRESTGAASSAVELPVGPDPSNDLAFRYEGRVLPGTYELAPRLVTRICPGGTWSPSSRYLSVSEIDGSPSGARTDHDFAYSSVPLTATRIPVTLMTAVIQGLFQGTEIRLNNSGPESPRGSWFKADDAWIRLSEELGGTEIPLDLPAGRGGVYQYYVHDVNLSAIRVAREGEAIAIRLHFESGDIELKGYCWGTRGPIDLECPVGPDDSAPDVHIDDLVVKILLPPARFVPDRGPAGISYGVPLVVATANIQARGVCDVVDVCDLLTDYKNLILTGIERALVPILDQRWMRQTVADGMRATLSSPPIGPIGDVNSVGFEGSDLVIRHRPR